jgi:hypothetical protein
LVNSARRSWTWVRISPLDSVDTPARLYIPGMLRRSVLLLAVAACTKPVPQAPVDDEPLPPDEDPVTTPATVLFLDSAGRAVPLACSAPGVGLYLKPGDCVELLGDERTIGDLGQGRRTLGDPSDWFCASNRTSRRAFRIDKAPGRRFEDGDPANELVVWPAERSFDVTVWERSDGTLRVDLDRDGGEDVLRSVEHQIIGEMSDGETVVLLSDHKAMLQAYAAVDLDGDGDLEVIVAAPYDDGDWTAVEHYDPSTRTLSAVTGIGCGPL